MTSFWGHFDGFWVKKWFLRSFLGQKVVLGSKNEKKTIFFKTSRSFCHFKWRFHIGKPLFCIFQGGDPGFLEKPSFWGHFWSFFAVFWSFLIIFSSKHGFEGPNHCHQRFEVNPSIWGQKKSSKSWFWPPKVRFFWPNIPGNPCRFWRSFLCLEKVRCNLQVYIYI